MQIIFDKKLYKANLARSCKRFSNHDFIFKLVSNNIKERLDEINVNFTDILEIGSRNILYDMISDNKNYVQTNIQESFLDPAKEIVIADCELLPFEDESFDLVLSALELHFANDLPGSLVQIKNILKKNGMMIASIFGGRTLEELRRSIVEAEISLTIPSSPHIMPMIDIKSLTELVQRIGFKEIVVDSYVITVEYSNVIKLMHDLRYMGQGNILVKRSGKPITARLLQKIEEIYATKYQQNGQLIASFEIINITGIKQ